MIDLIIADPHLTDKEVDSYRFAIMHRIPAIVKKRYSTIDRIIILGDLTENKDRHSESLVYKIVNMFNFYMRTFPNSQIIVLAGNHCGITAQRSFFRFMPELNTRIEYITVPMGIEYGYGKELFLPYERVDILEKWREFMPFNSRYKRIYMHQTVQGATAANSLTLDGLDAHLFRRAGVVISGDVHTAQTIGDESRNGAIHYVGSPYPIDFGDADGGRVFVARSGERTALESITVSSIKKAKITVRGDLATDELEGADIGPEGSMYHVTVNMTQRNLNEWHDIKHGVRSFIEERNCKAIRIHPSIEKVTANQRGRKRDMSKLRPEEVIKRYASENKLDSYHIGVGLQLMKGGRD